MSNPLHIHAFDQYRTLLEELSKAAAASASVYYRELVDRGVDVDAAVKLANARVRDMDDRVLGRIMQRFEEKMRER